MTGRAVSDVIGYVALFSVVAIVVAVISLGGVAALEDTRDRERVSNAERAFDVMADNVADVYAEGAPSRATEINLDGASLSTDESLTVQLRAQNATGWENLTRPITSELVTWEPVSGDESINYALGAVLRTGNDSGLVLRGGPLRIDSDRTILSIVQTYSRQVQRQSGGTVLARATGENPGLVAVGDADPDWTALWMNLSTAAPGPWQRYLESHDGVTCVDTPRWDVACSLPVPNQLYVVVHPVRIDLER